MSIPSRLISALKAGKIVLFLGAGANYNCMMANGEAMPSGDKLSDMLSKRFSIRKANSLGETAELVEASYTRAELNAFIIETLTGAIPSEDAVEGKYGEGKRKYHLNRILAKLKDTAESMIAMHILVMNLERQLRVLFVRFLQMLFGRSNVVNLA